MSSVSNKKVENYINEVCNLVKNKRVHEDIKDELVSHIKEIAEDYIDCGICEEEAYEKALLQMGSSNVIGRDLNKVHKAMPDWIVIGFTAAFILFGLFVLSSILDTYSTDYGYDGLIKKTIIIALVGVIIFFASLRVDYRNIKKYSRYIYGVTIFIMLIVAYIDTPIYGEKGWVMIGRNAINAYSIVPFVLIIALAGIFDKWDWNNRKSLFIGISLVVAPFLPFFMGKNFTDIIIYSVSVVILLIISGLRIGHILTVFGSIGVVSVIFILSEDYRREMFGALINPSKDPEGIGWIYNQLNKVREAARLFGSGAEFNESVLPSAHTDFVFSYIIYSFGIIVGIILVALILVFIIRIGFIGARTKDSYGKLLVSGLCSLYGIQFLLSILITFNLMPVVAVSMPFISYSGIQLLINILGVGIICNVYKWRNIKLIVA